MHVQRLRACESPDYDEEKEKWKDRDHRVRIARRVVEDPGGFRDFKHAGWGRAAAPLFFTWSLGGGEEAGQFKLDDTGTEALLFGRVTYEEFAAAWSARDDELADKFNSLPKYVISSTLEDADWNNTTVLRGNLMEEVSRLRRIWTETSSSWERPARTGTDRERPRRRAAADGLSGRAGSW